MTAPSVNTRALPADLEVNRWLEVRSLPRMSAEELAWIDEDHRHKLNADAATWTEEDR